MSPARDRLGGKRVAFRPVASLKDLGEGKCIVGRQGFFMVRLIGTTKTWGGQKKFLGNFPRMPPPRGYGPGCFSIVLRV